MDIKRNYHNTSYIKPKSKGLLLLVLFSVAFFILSGTTLAEDNSVPPRPPEILYHVPEIDAGQVPVNGAITVVWDRPMHPETNFKVSGPEGFLDGAFLYDPETYTVSFIPEQNLLPDTRYGVTVVGQVDIGGQVQQETYHWNFNTVSPTSVSLVSLNSAEEGLERSWWWPIWPALMVLVSFLSLGGFFILWSRRRAIV